MVSIKGQDTDKLASQFGVRFESFFMEPDGAMLGELGALIDRGIVKPVIGKTFSMEQSAIRRRSIIVKDGHPARGALAPWRRCRAASFTGGSIMETNSTERRQREPWNKGKLVGQKAPFKPKDVWAMRARMQQEHRTRDLVLLNLGIDSKLRGCDLVALKVRDIQHGGQIAPRAIITQHKRGPPREKEMAGRRLRSDAGRFRVRAHHAQPVRGTDRFGAGAHVEFGEDGLQVMLDRSRRAMQALCDFLVAQTGAEELEDGSFLARERGRMLLRRVSRAARQATGTGTAQLVTQPFGQRACAQ